MGKYRYCRQKHAVIAINFKDKFFHEKPLLREMNILSVYETNIFQTLCLMLNCRTSIITLNVFLIYTNQKLLPNTHWAPFEPYLSHTIEEGILNLSSVFVVFLCGIRFSPKAPQ